MAQPAFGAGSHDSLQYHFFCDELFLSTRFFLTGSLFHYSAWIYDGESREILNVSNAPGRKQEKGSHLNIIQPELEVSELESKGLLKVKNRLSEPIAQVNFEAQNVILREDPFESKDEKTIYYPNIKSTVEYKGRLYQGIGFCKRYWGDYPRVWGYRFINGITGADSLVVWTADATFGHAKYDYFRVIEPDGTLSSAEPNSSYQKTNRAFATIGGIRYALSFDEIAQWETVLKSDAMESHLRQRYGLLLLERDGDSIKGVALNEVCFGVLG
jgi:hypothetical protein